MILYIFWSASTFVVIIFTSDCSLRHYPIMLGFYMRIEGRIREIRFITCPTCKLPSFFITSRFPSFFLFNLWCLWILRIIFDIKIMYHVHRFHRPIVNHPCLTFIIFLSNREKLSIIFLLHYIGLLLSGYNRHPVIAN